MKLYLIQFLLIELIVISANKDEVVVVSTWGSQGFVEATKTTVNLLKATGNRMNALVEGLSVCESLQCDRTVGFGGSPDESGETTLDAMVIDSEGMKIGAVANLHRIREAAKVAWAVLNFTKHTLIVGESATQFAKSMGFVEMSLTTNESKSMHEDWINAKCQPNFWKNVSPDPSKSCGPYKPTSISSSDVGSDVNNEINEYNHDTIGMVVMDSNNLFSAGTSSNGARNKIPGRVGDSPIPGAGAYASEFGGAAATGDGDIMMRFLPSFYVVEQFKLGAKPFKATKHAIERIIAQYPQFKGAVVALNKRGQAGATCANMPHFAYNTGYKNGTVVTKKIRCIFGKKTKKENLKN